VQRRAIAAGTWERDAAAARLRREMTFEEYARSWLRDRSLKPRTRDGYRHLLERYLLPDPHLPRRPDSTAPARGAGFEGIKPAGAHVPPQVVAADEAVSSGRIDPLRRLVDGDRWDELERRFDQVMAVKGFEVDDRQACGRAAW
jgi:hypothetical protein